MLFHFETARPNRDSASPTNDRRRHRWPSRQFVARLSIKNAPVPVFKNRDGSNSVGHLEKMRSHMNEGQASASDHQWRLKLLRAAEHIKSKARSRRLLRLARPRYSLRS